MSEIVLQNKSFKLLNESELYVIDGGDKSDYDFGEFIGTISATVTGVIFAPIITNYMFFKAIFK